MLYLPKKYLFHFLLLLRLISGADSNIIASSNECTAFYDPLRQINCPLISDMTALGLSKSVRKFPANEYSKNYKDKLSHTLKLCFPLFTYEKYALIVAYWLRELDEWKHSNYSFPKEMTLMIYQYNNNLIYYNMSLKAESIICDLFQKKDISIFLEEKNGWLQPLLQYLKSIDKLKMSKINALKCMKVFPLTLRDFLKEDRNNWKLFNLLTNNELIMQPIDPIFLAGEETFFYSPPTSKKGLTDNKLIIR